MQQHQSIFISRSTIMASIILLCLWNPILQADLLVRYPFNEGQGTNILDASGRGNHALAHNIDESAWTYSIDPNFASCLQLDGINQYVKTVDVLDEPLTGDLTAMIWFTAEPLSGTSNRGELSAGQTCL